MATTTEATCEAPTGAGERTVPEEMYRDLLRVNGELQVRIRELELQLASGTQPVEAGEEDSGASGEGTSIVDMIKDLHAQIDAAHELKESLEADLFTMSAKLAEERGLGAESEARIRLLEAKAALGDHLRDDLALVEEERNEIARSLEEAAARLGRMTEERDRLARSSQIAERELMTLNGRIESMKKERDVSKRELRQIRIAIMRSTSPFGEHGSRGVRSANRNLRPSVR